MKKSECYERAVRAVIACTGGDISADDMDILYLLLSDRHCTLITEKGTKQMRLKHHDTCRPKNP